MKKNSSLNKYRIAVFVLLCIHSWLLSSTITIKQDGSGDFTTIQAGIEASSDADTILVHPGTYFENLNFAGKSIIVASLYLTTGNDQYISQTIINGNQSGSCVQVMNGENENTTLCGFFLTNGSGTFEDNTTLGGSIYVNDSNLNIISCIITDNKAYVGGGIGVRNSHVFLSKTTIKNNTGIFEAGGIEFVQDSTIEFDPDALCNIFLNYAGLGNEIGKGYSCPATTVIVDTFTVAESSSYFIDTMSPSGVPLNDVTLIMQHAKIEQVDCDLYVAADGSNDNDGLSQDSPLQTLNYALAKMSADIDTLLTLHVANGEYSRSLNNQVFPLNLPGNVSIIGESMEGVIWDAEYYSMFASDIEATHNYTIKNITLLHAKEKFSFACAFNVNVHMTPGIQLTYENLLFKECSRRSAHLISNAFRTMTLRHITSINNDSEFLRIFRGSEFNSVHTLENIRITNNQEPLDPESYPAKPQISIDANYVDFTTVNMTNVEITNNVQRTYWPDDILAASAIQLLSKSHVQLVNCTIADNVIDPSFPGSYAAGIFLIEYDNHVTSFNSIFYNNNPLEMYVMNIGPFNTPYCTIAVDYSLVQNGEDGIDTLFDEDQVFWRDNNLPADADPLWLGSGDYPYMLSEGSPCIDAGTMDLPAGIELPEFDLAGNPRISGDGIDMGAYEYQDSTAVEPPLPKPPVRTSISSYPNPFRPSTSRSGGTTIMLELVEEGPITVDIYNIKGQKVLNLMDSTTCPGTYKFTWNGRDAENQQVASGQYFVKVVQKGQTTASKMLLLK